MLSTLDRITALENERTTLYNEMYSADDSDHDTYAAANRISQINEALRELWIKRRCEQSSAILMRAPLPGRAKSAAIRWRGKKEGKKP